MAGAAHTVCGKILSAGSWGRDMWTRCRSCRQLFAAARVDERILFAAGPIDPCRHGVRWSLFPEGRLWSLALGMIAASGLGVFIVGLAPEDVTPDWHYLGATENFLFGNVGAALLGLALLCERPSRRRVGLNLSARGPCRAHLSSDANRFRPRRRRVGGSHCLSIPILDHGHGRLAGKRRRTESASTTDATDRITRG